MGGGEPGSWMARVFRMTKICLTLYVNHPKNIITDDN